MAQKARQQADLFLNDRFPVGEFAQTAGSAVSMAVSHFRHRDARQPISKPEAE